jgi:hypothetical protein
MRSDFDRHVATGRARPGRWRFQIGAVPGCRGASACFIAEFRARRRARPRNDRTLKLIRGRTGYYAPLRCGASCAPPSIEWRDHRVLYTIEAKVGTRRTERRLLVRMANSAIRHGAR